MQDLAKHHAHALRRLLYYLRYTIKSRILFGPSRKLVIYSNADYVSNKADRKSITALVRLIGRGPVFQGSRKQTAVATATIEVEYVIISVTAKQGQQVTQILRDIGYGRYVSSNYQTVNTRSNNQGAIALAKNPYLTKRSKYIDITYYYIRDLQERRRASISYILTVEIVANSVTILIKPQSHACHVIG